MVSVVEEDAQVVPITKTTRRKKSKDGEASKDPS
jgi:hypothetical protein